MSINNRKNGIYSYATFQKSIVICNQGKIRTFTYYNHLKCTRHLPCTFYFFPTQNNKYKNGLMMVTPLPLPGHSKTLEYNDGQMRSIAVSVQQVLLLDLHTTGSFSCFTWQFLSHSQRSFLTTDIPLPLLFQLQPCPTPDNIL